MTPATTFSGKSVALFGLGGSGLVTAKALKAGGANVTVWDDAESSREKARAAGLHVEDLALADWRGFSSFILSPGVPLTHPKPHWSVDKAKAAGVEIIGDIEIFCRERAALAPDAPFIAITGTNGKSTTTALTAHILKSAGRDTQMGGNIGVAILALDPPAPNRVHVIEISTFQIDLTPSLKPGIGVLLNLTPDHIDRHGTFENYAALKERLIANADIAFVSVDDEPCYEIGKRNNARTFNDPERANCPVSAIHALDWGIYVEDNLILSRRPGEDSAQVLGNLAGIATLRGAHNAQNAAFAAAACDALGITPDEIQRGLETFPGLAHRMEQVGRIGKVLFINDSKATNADAAEKALLTFDHIHWILGGKSKEGGIEPLKSLFSKVSKAYLIGASTEDFAKSLDGHVPYERCGTLDVATRRAAQDAAETGAPAVVLLSPACASYDQFANFEVRGEAFRTLVKSLEASA